MIIIIILAMLFILSLTGLSLFSSIFAASWITFFDGLVTASELSYYAVTRTIHEDGIPILLFIIAGKIIFSGGLAMKISDLLNYFIGRLKIFMPLSAVLVTVLFSSVSDSSASVVAAAGSLCYPLLVSAGYDKAFSASIIMCAGILTYLIPPSTPLKIMTGLSYLNAGICQRVGLFLGIILTVALIIYIYVYCSVTSDGDQKKLSERHEKIKSQGFFATLFDGFWVFAMLVVVSIGLMTKFLTPSRAGAVCVLLGSFLTLRIYKTLTLEKIINLIRDTMLNIMALLIVLFAANFLSSCIEELGILNIITEIVEGFDSNFQTATLLTLGMLIILGMFAESLNSVYMLVLVIVPMAFRLGGEPYHALAGMLGIRSIGLLTPPVGVGLFAMMNISGLTMIEILKKSWVPLIIYIIICFMFALFPGLTGFIV